MTSANKNRTRKFSISALAAALAFALPSPANAEDVDLFVGAAATAENPNVLVIIDNSSNWSSASQQWTDPNGVINPFKQGQSELRALRTVAGELTDKINFGLMMFTEGTGSNAAGAYVRFHVRQMTAANRTAFRELIGPDAGCINGPNSLNLTPNCIFKNFDTATEKTGTAKTDYSAALFEAFKYLGGYTSPAHAHDDVAGSPVDATPGPTATHFGAVRFSGDPDAKSDAAAYVDGAKGFYNPPIGANSCAKNYIIFIGNGFPRQDLASTVLNNVGGSATQLSMPVLSTQSVTEIVGESCGTSGNEAQRLADCTANIPLSLKEEFAHHQNFSCVAGSGTLDALKCGANANARKYLVQAERPNVVTQTGQNAVPGTNEARMTDEWAKFLYTTDVNIAAGQQNVRVHTIDVFKDAQDARQTSLLFNMAKVGGGKYYQANSEEDILNAIRQILIEIQSVNSVFASASLPINATNRSQNENQVFIGMFRPDPAGLPRWYGNLKRYQIALFGQEAKLADKNGVEAVSSETGFIQPCAASFWTTDSSTYWDFLPESAGLCTTAGTSVFSDLPDGPNVEKGAVAEIVRKGNDPPSTDTSPTFQVNRSIYTCANDGATVDCKTDGSAMHSFDTTNVGMFALGVLTATDHTALVDFVRGVDVKDDNTNTRYDDVRPSVHGDVAHSRPLPVNYASTGVVVYYGANDGTLRAVQGRDGKELWSFIAPEHHDRFFRLWQQEPLVLYPTMQPPFPIPTPTRKDYFFDGSAGLFQNADDSKVWIFPSMRRGGRMIYAFDVTIPTGPRMKWRVGCTNPSMFDTASCNTGYEQMGQTWSTPAVALVRGFHATNPLIVVGGGYDTCEDQDAAPNTECTATGYTRRGNRVYVIDANTGGLIRSFATNGSVPGDVTLVDRNFDGYADHAYVADTTGSIYRLDFVDPANPASALASTAWTITEVARTSGDDRKFLFPPAALPAADQVYLSIASGDRERPLRENYPFPTATNPGILNRAYMVVDKFATTGPIDLDGTNMEDMTAGAGCPTLTDNPEARGADGWFINLNATSSDPAKSNGEQAVTASVIFGGLIFFSTNRPQEISNACTNNLGEARGYALNLLNGSGAADTSNICGGTRSQVFVGGGLPPSPVTGTVPVGGKPVTVMIGGVQRTGGASSPIGAQRVTPSITQRRSRTYWYTEGDK